MKGKKNCWEHFQCGREPGGKNVKELGVCPVTQAKEKDGVNQGKAAGRLCWTIEGSLCSVTIGHKFEKCITCPFYLEVESEEGTFFVLGLDDI